MYGPRYRALFELLYGRAPTGLERSVIEAAEERLGFPIPPPLRDFHLVCGGEDHLTSAYNIIVPPRLLEREDGRLVFCEEHQGVCVWGCTPWGENPDAEVGNVLPDDSLEWHAEGATLGSFLSVLVLLQTAWGGFEFVEQLPSSQAALVDAGIEWDRGVRHRELTIYVADGTVAAAFDDHPSITGAGRTAAHLERLMALTSP